MTVKIPATLYILDDPFATEESTMKCSIPRAATPHEILSNLIVVGALAAMERVGFEKGALGEPSDECFRGAYDNPAAVNDLLHLNEHLRRCLDAEAGVCGPAGWVYDGQGKWSHDEWSVARREAGGWDLLRIPAFVITWIGRT